jgi:hypothetical protein
VRHQRRRRTHRAQHREAPLGRRVEQARAIAVEAVEEERRQRPAGGGAGVAVGPADVPHRVLEAQRPAAGQQRDHFAIEHEFARGQRPHQRDQLRQRGRDVVERAREHAHVVAAAVHLHAHAVELPLEHGACLRQLRQRVGDVGRRAGKHRLHRAQQLQVEACDARSALGERRVDHCRQIGGEHLRAPHRGRRQSGRQRDRVDDEALERALPQLARQHAGEELLLLRGRAAEQLSQRLLAAAGRARAVQGSDRRERRVDVVQRETRRGCRCGAERLHDLGGADAGPGLAQLAREVERGQRPLGRGRSRQRRRDRRGLLAARAHRRDRGRARDQRGQLHG